MEIIGVIGLLLAIASLIFLSYRGVNAFIASLIASLVVIVTNMLPFWETFAGGGPLPALKTSRAATLCCLVWRPLTASS